MPKTRHDLPLEDKVRLVKEAESKSQRKLAADFGISLGAVNGILRHKESILKEFEDGALSSRSRRKGGSFVDIDNRVHTWFHAARSKRIPVSGPMVKAKALEIATAIGEVDFKASNGWLARFQARNKISARAVSGESGGVDQTTVEEWKTRLPQLCDGFKPQDIFNADETGLFFRALPKRSLVEKGDSCHGIKSPKDRITLLLCASMTGEKLKPLAIGNAVKPRCFRNIKVDSLPVSWTANKRAWMTSALFVEWLKALDKKMRNQRRRILLFLDNALSHPMGVTLTNVTVKFLPPNVTSVLQPLDQGVISNLKRLFKQRLLRHVLSKIDTASNVNEILKSVNVLHAVQWSSNAWDQVQPTTITKCFVKCGFPSESPDSDWDADDDLSLRELISRGAEIGVCDDVTPEEYVRCDETVRVPDCEDDDWENDLMRKDDDEENVDKENGDEEEVEDMQVTVQDGLSCVQKLKTLFLNQGWAELLAPLERIEHSVQVHVLENAKSKPQSFITSWLRDK